MNRTFLILLMIGTAMLITVIGQRDPSVHLDTMPWEVIKLENGSLRVFGITLEKTTIQEANQIFADFADTRLQVIDYPDSQQLQLVANYDDLSIGGLSAQLQLIYRVKQNDLQAIFKSINKTQQIKQTHFIDNSTITSYPVADKIKIAYLNKHISSIIYIPSIDYDRQTIQQNFGVPSEEEQIDKNSQIWHYPEMGLKIYIHHNKPDRFVYKSL